MASLILQLIPLVILFAFVGAIAFVLYHIYLTSNKIQETATEKMNKKNVTFTKDGMRVGVKQVGNENYVDKTQRVFVKAWNLGNDSVEESRRQNKKK